MKNKYSTLELSELLKVKVRTIRQGHYENGHYKGFKPCGYSPLDRKMYVWHKPD
jgi:hypothetical protein